jgi:peptide deformylase
MIIVNNEELLRRPCTDVLPEEVGELRDLLQRELDNSARLGRPGIGLAAPQIGVLKKMAIVRINNELQLDLVNCKIEKGYDPLIFQNESCLSYPNISKNTIRYQEVYITNNFAQPNRFIATGLFAVCIQHELDHLNSILFFDRVVKQVDVGIGRNDPCPCGTINPLTNKIYKYKKHCGKNV